MAFKFRILLHALYDLNDSIDWYKNKSENTSKAFYNDFETTLHYIIDNPYLFPVKYKNFRECRFSKFRYIIIYEIIDDTVVVSSVFNTSQNPEKKTGI